MNDIIDMTEGNNISEENSESRNRCQCPLEKRTKERSEKERKELMNRLKRIEGQIRGIQRMLENNAYCTDVMVQVSAVNSALNGFNKLLLENHLHTCVAENIRRGNDDIIDELALLLRKLMR